ncbi:TRAP transporter small permease [Planococcus sp. X10-3]|uniref:TRAP transporter small permease n=1 Tax=Planococcus sp. X10-3 TaxID=3061240 RepID=UPI003BB13C54
MKEKVKERDYARPFRTIIALMLLTIVGVTILQVVSRFVFNEPLTWPDELGRFLLIWMVFIGAAVVSFDDRHLGVEFIQEKMSPKVKLISSMIIRLLILLFLFITIFSSFELIQIAHMRSSAALGIPDSYWRIAAPVGAALMIFYVVIRSILDIRSYRAGTFINRSVMEEMKK